MNTRTPKCVRSRSRQTAPWKRDQPVGSRPGHTPSPPTKSLDFRGFHSSRLLILRGGNSHVR